MNGDGEIVFVCSRRRAYGKPACDTGMHVKVSDLERAMRDAVAQWAADIDAAARDRVQQAARDSAQAAVRAWRRATANCAGGCRLALEQVADAKAGGILGDDAWAEAALALRADHTTVLGDLERARAAAAPADTSALLPDLLAQWDILPSSALNAILRTVVRRVAVYREASGGRGRAGGGSRRRTGSRGAAGLGGRPLEREHAATRPARRCRTSGLCTPRSTGTSPCSSRAATSWRCWTGRTLSFMNSSLRSKLRTGSQGGSATAYADGSPVAGAARSRACAHGRPLLLLVSGGLGTGDASVT